MIGWSKIINTTRQIVGPKPSMMAMTTLGRLSTGSRNEMSWASCSRFASAPPAAMGMAQKITSAASARFTVIFDPSWTTLGFNLVRLLQMMSLGRVAAWTSQVSPLVILVPVALIAVVTELKVTKAARQYSADSTVSFSSISPFIRLTSLSKWGTASTFSPQSPKNFVRTIGGSSPFSAASAAFACATSRLSEFFCSSSVFFSLSFRSFTTLIYFI
mmetsp:Transcript_14602/g.20433  ORF Transcript_14602/g.20433 Transcript_14602/m.20433 type:complete len:216 (-) Transcript_14602:683-1330(-)